MAPYTLIFGVTLAVNVLITFRSSSLWKKFCGGSREQAEAADPTEVSTHRTLLRNYLMVYLTATLSDWLQGPYVYALYDAYGYSQHDIAVLFVAGFGSSKLKLFRSGHRVTYRLMLCNRHGFRIFCGGHGRLGRA